ncbi:heavy-metal-associated domain-containing protein [Egicoccus sp. AB-alg6-2]|uniref:heavy-metal-associated domain-containing protein n=1 Tax=Egicoccus sp. AB-alg6-2 TaxID=3242692 RepID=UPI00359EE84F
MLNTRTYHVPDISCDHCRNSIEGALDDVAGVDSRMVDIESKTVVVTGSASEDAVTKAISDAGYEVERVTGAGSMGGHPGPMP